MNYGTTVREKKIVRNRAHKWFLRLLKYIPIICALGYSADHFHAQYDYDLRFTPILGVSTILIILLLLASVVFKFCLFHRLPIYYIVTGELFDYAGKTHHCLFNDDIHNLLVAILGLLIIFIVLEYDRCHKKVINGNNI